MSRSHPPSLLTHVERTLRGECELPAGAAIAIAVSGGSDSMALCHALHFVRKKFDLKLAVLTLDHGLRAEAKKEVELVGAFCDEHEIAWSSRVLSLARGGNLQERARDLRYAALWEMAEEQLGSGAFLATAHHQDDRAETVLLRLLRGSSLEGLSVLPPRSDRLLRPMIRATKSDVLAHIERHSLPFCSDPSNTDPRFLRVRTRLELLPLLREMGPGIVDHLTEISDDAGRLAEPLGLNREQRSQIRRALRDPRFPVNLPLPGGLRLQRMGKNQSQKSD